MDERHCQKRRERGRRHPHLAQRLVPDAAQPQDLSKGQAQHCPPQAAPGPVVEGPGEGQGPGPDQLGGQETQNQQQPVGQVRFPLLGVLQKTLHNKSLQERTAAVTLEHWDHWEHWWENWQHCCKNWEKWQEHWEDWWEHWHHWWEHLVN